MSYDIFYKKAFIRVGELFIPMVNHGSSNSWELNYSGKEIPEKYWSVLNYPYKGRVLFSKEEIKKIADEYEESNTHNRGGMRKTRNTTFEIGEFKRWFLAGMRAALTVEQYTSYDNCVHVVNYGNWTYTCVKTTEELLAAIKRLDGKLNLGVSFADNREVHKPKKFRERVTLNVPETDSYFVLKYKDKYFVKRSSKHFWLNPDPNNSRVKKFLSHAEAVKYLKRNEQYFRSYPLQIKFIKGGIAV